MLVIGLALLLMILILVKFTGGTWIRRESGETFGPAQVVPEVSERALSLPGRGPVQGEVVLDLLERLGVGRNEAAADLKRRGFAVPDPSPEVPRMSVVRSGEVLLDAVERALLVGVQMARWDDDYAGVGDDKLDAEALARRAEEAEVELFGEGRRERYALYGKVSLVLQDMLQAHPEGERRETILRLLEVFDRELEALQEEMAAHMARVPEPEGLLWGDRSDRFQYYFKMGVTNSLRRSGHLESLGHLYRLQGVNYDVEEAYELAARECAPLVLAESIGIERLLRMGPGDVQALVRRHLPEG